MVGYLIAFVDKDEEEIKSGHDGSCHVDVLLEGGEEKEEEREEGGEESKGMSKREGGGGGGKEEERYSHNVTCLIIHT